MDLSEVREKMHKLVEYVKNDVASIRTGRANSSLVDSIMINAYGGTAKMKVIEVAQVMVPDVSSITITPYDQSIIGDIRRDIEAANVGLTPVIDNNLIRITVPSLTSERRLEYVKMLHVKLEDGRVKIRQIRHEKMGELKREFEERKITEDDKRGYEEELQKITDTMMAEIETIGKTKETELMVI